VALDQLAIEFLITDWTSLIQVPQRNLSQCGKVLIALALHDLPPAFFCGSRTRFRKLLPQRLGIALKALKLFTHCRNVWTLARNVLLDLLLECANPI